MNDTQQFSAERLQRLAHISTDEIRADLAETEREIDALRKVQDAERIIAQYALAQNERTMANFRAGARTGQIAERQAFADKLRALLGVRYATEGSNDAR